MFKRRNPHGPMRLLREVFWPSMGWSRAFRYIKHRLLRLSDTNYSIAAGLASGACISFTPLLGTHFIQAGVLAYFIRGNLLASLIGTFAGNPWTFPFMWVTAYGLGVFILQLLGLTQFADLPDNFTMSVIWDMMWDQPLSLFLPLFVGGYLLAILFWPIFFFGFYYLVRGAKRARALAKVKRRQYLERKARREAQEALLKKQPGVNTPVESPINPPAEDTNAQKVPE